ncbi:MAG: hypothetical protein AMJ78_09175 [Omnitrophica WOR_2 bacterium SM23_29]|nr:MAG: hypothetical protein AMJ78_09175 [Omnitrophica WOR_2 bacterium SM23_29]
MKVAKAVGQGFRVAHKGWHIILVLFLFNAVMRFFVAPIEDIPPLSRTHGEWGVIWLIFFISVFGLSYLWGGVLGFAHDRIKHVQVKFRRFFGNCNRYFLRQLGLNVVVGVPLWIMAVLSAALLSGAFMVARRSWLASAVLGSTSIVLSILGIALFILFSFSWTIIVAKDAKIFKAIAESFLFVGKRFAKVVGLLALLFIIALAIFLVVGIIYALLNYVLKRIGITNLEKILTELLGCILYAYFGLLSASSFMAYYLNNNETPEMIGAA